MPDVVFESEDKIPEGLKEFARKLDDGSGFAVKVVPSAKLDEFREKNIALAKERDEFDTFIKSVKPILGEDLEAFQTELTDLRATAQKVKDGKLKMTDDVEAEVIRRVDSMKKNFETQLSEQAKNAAEWQKKAALSDSKYRQTIVDRYVTDAILDEKNGANPQALNDILQHARSVFRVKEDESIVPMDGDAVIYGNDGATPMTPAEWLAKLKVKAPYFFKNSNGGGATGDRGSTKYGGYTQEEFNKLPAAQKLAIANKMSK